MKKTGPFPVVGALAILAVALAAAPAASAATWYLPGATEIEGQNKAYYSSTLWVTNGGTAPATIEFRFIPFAGMPGATPVVRSLQAGETREYARVLPTLFGLSRGAGTIVLTTEGTVVANLSTANTADPKGTFGLSVRPVAEAELAGAGARHEVVFASHKADLKTASRTNVAAVLVDPGTALTVVVYDGAGAELGRRSVSSATPVHYQESLGAIVGDRDVPLGRVAFEVSAGRVAVYDSVVDNVTNDGFVIQGVPSGGARTRWMLAGLARATGERGTFWTSDVWVHNPQAAPIQVTFTPWIAGAAPFTRTVAARGILQIADIVGAGGFGLERGSGVVELGSPAAFFVESRTYNSDPADPSKGTYSATVRPFSDDLLVRGPGQAAVNAAEASDAFRSNLTLFSPTGGALGLRLVDQQGTELARTTASLGAKTSWQQSLAGWFESGASSVGTLSVPAGFKGAVLVDVPADVSFQGYLSRVDNGTGDGMAPTFTVLQGCTPPAITSFTATPASSTAGAPVTLALAATGCVSARVTPGDLSIPCNGTVTVTPTQTTEYTATATGACAPPATAKATVNVGCPAITVEVRASGATDLCEFDSVRLTATASGCASCVITWERNGAEWTTGAFIDVSTAGSYVARARDAARCTAASSPITVTTSPAPNPAITAPATVGGGSTGNAASVPDAGNGATYAWTITNGTITAGQGTAAITFTASATGTVSLGVTVTSAAGCAASDSRSVGIDCTPPSATITVAAEVCANATGQSASVPDAGVGAAYAWTITNGTITGGAGTRAITWSAGATGPVQLSATVTIGAGCSNTGNANVTVNPLVSGSISANPTTVDGGDTTTLTLTVANATSWWLSSALGNSFSQANGTNNGTFNVIYGADNNAGLDTVTLTINGVCGGPTTYTVQIRVCDSAAATITAPASVCANASGQSASVPDAGAGATYGWLIANGSITAGQGTNAITWSAGPTGPVELSVTIQHTTGCTSSGMKSVAVDPLPTVTSFTATPSAISGGDTATLNFTIANGDSWSLASSIGNTFSPQNGTGNGAMSATYNAFFNTGSDTVTLTVTNGCGNKQSTTSIIVCEPPDATITAPGSVCPLTAGYPVSVPNAGIGATYVWSTMQATIFNGQGTPNIIIDTASAGPVTVNVTVTSASGCSKSSSVVIPMNPLPTVSVSVSPSTIAFGGTSTVTITCTNCTSWSLSNDQGDPIAPASGVGSGTFTATYTSAAGPAFPSTITATGTNGCGSTQATTSLTITP